MAKSLLWLVNGGRKLSRTFSAFWGAKFFHAGRNLRNNKHIWNWTALSGLFSQICYDFHALYNIHCKGCWVRRKLADGSEKKNASIYIYLFNYFILLQTSGSMPGICNGISSNIPAWRLKSRCMTASLNVEHVC